MKNKNVRIFDDIQWGNRSLNGLSDSELLKLDNEQLNRIQNGINAVESGQLKEAAKKGGEKMGQTHLKNGTGLFGRSKKQIKEDASKAGKLGGMKNVLTGHVKIAGKISAKSPNHPNNTKQKCIHCGYESTLPLIRRWHNDNCKHKQS